MLLANNLTFKRDEKIIFENISISTSPGKITFVRGNNGSGKTTLIKTLVKILEPETGEIFWMGKKLKKNILNFYNSVTLILDKPTSSLELTVLENIIFWKNISCSNIKNEEIITLLKLLKLEKYQKTKTIYLSKGEIQKLELTRLIVEQKKLWILDEPYISLDNESIDIINETFIDHSGNDGMIIFSSHYEPDLKNLETLLLD